MALHINKDRSNLDGIERVIAAEDFINSMLDSFATEPDNHTSSSNTDDIFYEWDSDYKKFMQDINDKRTTAKYNKWKSYYEFKD